MVKAAGPLQQTLDVMLTYKIMIILYNRLLRTGSVQYQSSLVLREVTHGLYHRTRRSNGNSTWYQQEMLKTYASLRKAYNSVNQESCSKIVFSFISPDRTRPLTTQQCYSWVLCSFLLLPDSVSHRAGQMSSAGHAGGGYGREERAGECMCA